MIVSNDDFGARQLGYSTCSLKSAMPWFKRKAWFGRWLGCEDISKVAVEPATVESDYFPVIAGLLRVSIGMRQQLWLRR